MNYKAKIEHRIAGIPCLIGVIDYAMVRGSYNYNAPSDLDYYGYEDMAFDILDRGGRLAPWLEKKVSDYSDIREAISRELS